MVNVKREGKWVKQRAHIAAWEVLKGPRTPGLVLDHLCRNPGCYNPAHLEEVTVAENVLRGIGACAVNAQKTHCKHGHPLSGENVYWQLKKGKRYRTCRTCKVASRARAYAKERPVRKFYYATPRRPHPRTLSPD